MAEKRGLVISSPVTADQTRLTISGGIDFQELRWSLLLWDKLDHPGNWIVHVALSPDEEFLAKAGVLQRTTPKRRPYSGQAGPLYAAAHLAAFRELDEQEPGVWSLATGPRSFSFSEVDLAENRGVLVQLHQAIPIPDKDVPLAEILEFKVKHESELLALRYHLDSIYQRILSAGDGELALNSEIGALDLAIAEYIKTAKASRLPFVGMSFEANLNVPAAFIAGIASLSAGLSATTALLNGIGAGIAAGPSFSLKDRKESATPFQYISSFHKRLF